MTPSARTIAGVDAGFVLVTVLVAGGWAEGLYQGVNRGLSTLRSPALLDFAALVSVAARPTGVGLLCLVAGIVLWLRGKRLEIAAVWGAGVLSLATMEAVKALIARPRPEPLAGVVEAGASYPSGTTALVTAVLVCLAQVVAPSGPASRLALGLALAVVAVVAFCRLLLSVHYLTDVVGGACLGLLCAIAARAIVARIGGRS